PPGGGLRGLGRRHDADLPLESRPDGAAADARAHVCGRGHGIAGLSDRDVEPGKPFHGPRGVAAARRERRRGPEGPLPRHRPRQQPVAAVAASPRPLRVALLTSARAWRGSGVSLTHIARGLAARGHTVQLLSTTPPVTAGFAAAGLPVQGLPIPDSRWRGAACPAGALAA